MTDPLPADLLELLRQQIGSLEGLELLLLLRRTHERSWSVLDVARQLGLPESIVESTFDAMESQAFFATHGSPSGITWRYAPRSAELAALVDRLASVYESRRLEVMRVLSAQAMDRVRNSAARAFADAFVIGRKKDG